MRYIMIVVVLLFLGCEGRRVTRPNRAEDAERRLTNIESDIDIIKYQLEPRFYHREVHDAETIALKPNTCYTVRFGTVTEHKKALPISVHTFDAIIANGSMLKACQIDKYIADLDSLDLYYLCRQVEVDVMMARLRKLQGRLENAK